MNVRQVNSDKGIGILRRKGPFGSCIVLIQFVNKVAAKFQR